MLITCIFFFKKKPTQNVDISQLFDCCLVLHEAIWMQSLGLTLPAPRASCTFLKEIISSDKHLVISALCRDLEVDL